MVPPFVGSEHHEPDPRARRFALSQSRIVGYSLGALGALMVWVSVWTVPRIEARLESAVATALNVRGISVSSISADGRTVTVVGGPTSPEARLALAATVQNVPGVSEVRSLLVGDGEPRSDTPSRLADRAPEPHGTPAVLDREGAAPPEGGDEGPMEEGGAATEAMAGTGGGPEFVAPAEAAPENSEPASAAPTPVVDRPSPSEERVDEPRPEERPASCRVRLTRLAEGRTVPFGEGGTSLAEVDQAVLSQVAAELRSCGEWTLTIVGYASASEEPDAWVLADRRAYAVARFLLDRGIDESRLATVTGNTPDEGEGTPRVELFVSGGE
ncbi:MAG: OmpA family protein [Gemmatimonadota bacterium]|nr:OmpA family protein [Gemmatimonadota bacterium]